MFESIDSSDFIKEYRSKCFVLGKKVTVLSDMPYEALAENVDKDGKLIVLKSDGKRVSLSTDEVSVLPS